MTFKCCHFRQGSSRSPHPRRQGLLGLSLNVRPRCFFFIRQLIGLIRVELRVIIPVCSSIVI